MNKKSILLFDIDRTLLDTDKMSALRKEIILKTLDTTDYEKIKKIQNEYISTLKNERDYTPNDYLKVLAESFQIELKPLLDTYYGKENSYAYENAVFPQTRVVLNQLKDKFRMGIFSEGTKKFQNHKFRSMNLNEFFDDELIFINEAKDTMEVLNKIPEGAVVIDDKESICNFLYESGIKCIWLNKKDNRVSDKFQTIHSLLELSRILL